MWNEDMGYTHFCFPELGSCSHTTRLRPPVTHRWSPLPVVQDAKQMILGASGQVREARYRHWGRANTGKRLEMLKYWCRSSDSSLPEEGELQKLLTAHQPATHNLASALRLPDRSRSQLRALLSGGRNLLPQRCCCDWSVWTPLLWKADRCLMEGLCKYSILVSKKKISKSIPAAANAPLLRSSPVLQCRILSQARPSARNTRSPRGLSVRRPSRCPPQPVTWESQRCSSLRGSRSEHRFSHTDTPPSAEPLNTSGPWDCGGQQRLVVRVIHVWYMLVCVCEHFFIFFGKMLKKWKIHLNVHFCAVLA